MNAYLTFQKSSIQIISAIKPLSQILMKHYQMHEYNGMAVAIAPKSEFLIVNYLSIDNVEEMPLFEIYVNNDENLPLYENSLMFGCKQLPLEKLPDVIDVTAFNAIAQPINLNEMQNIFMHSYVSFKYMTVVQNFLRQIQKNGYS